LIDLDGVVYIGDSAVPGAPTAIRVLRERGKKILFLTNDPQSARIEYSRKLNRLAIDAVEDDVLTAAYATALYVQRHEKVGRGRTFVIGSRALKAELERVGLEMVDVEATEAEFVIVGGHDNFSYADLRTAAKLVRGGSRFVATGRDATFPMPGGPWPATGALLAAVETAAGTSAQIVGKPEPHMFDIARELLQGVDRLAVVGDRLDSDIEGGHRAGLATILIADSPPHAGQGGIMPDLTIPSLAALVVA
jgi:HAD superfamily hydrolase (TIGR01450 family)